MQSSLSNQSSVTHCFLMLRWDIKCLAEVAAPMPLPTLEVKRHMLTAELTPQGQSQEAAGPVFLGKGRLRENIALQLLKRGYLKGIPERQS